MTDTSRVARIPVKLTIDTTLLSVCVSPSDLELLDGLPADRARRLGTPIPVELTPGSVVAFDASRIAPR